MGGSSSHDHPWRLNDLGEATFLGKLHIIWLVVSTHPSEKYDIVSWDYDIPNWMESHKIPWFQSPSSNSTHDGSMVLLYMVLHGSHLLPSIYPSHVSINLPAPAGSGWSPSSPHQHVNSANSSGITAVFFPWIGLVGKILTGNHGFCHQI